MYRGKKSQLKIQVKHCQRHNGPRHCFYNLNWVQIWSPDGSAIWWVNLELLLVVPPGGQNWKQWSVHFEFSSGATWWLNLELMLVVPSGGQNWNQWSVYLEFSFLVNFPALKLER